jgi:PAS domain S-box-containing protein
MARPAGTLPLVDTRPRQDDPATEPTGAHAGQEDVAPDIYRAIVEQIPAVTYVALPGGADAPCTHISPQIESLLGIPVREWLDQPDLWTRSIHPHDRKRVIESLDQDPATFDQEYRMVGPDGRIVWVHDRATLVCDAEGSPRFWQGVMVDVTRSKEDEVALRESESMYRALVENVPAVVYVVAPDGTGTTLYVSPQVERVLGYTQAEWLEQPDIWMELLHPDDREIVLADHDLHEETGEPWSGEYRLIAADGRVIWFRDEATLVRDGAGRALFWQGVRLDITAQKRAHEVLRDARDELELRVRKRTRELEDANEMMMLEIAERKATEERLRRTERKYRTLVEQVPGAVVYLWDVSPSGPSTDAYMSPAIEPLLGYTVEEWHSPPGDFWLTRVHPDDFERVRAAARRSERVGETIDLEYRYLAKDGSLVWVHDKAVLMERAPDGSPKLLHGVLVDITARKEAEGRVLATEERYRALLEQIPGAVAYVWEVDPELRQPNGYTSPQIQELLGYPLDEWHGKPRFWVDRVHPDDRARVYERTMRCEATGEPFQMEYRYLAKDGSIVWVLDQATLVERRPDGTPWLFQGAYFDITERKESERRLREAEQRYRTLVEQIPAIVYMEAIEPQTPSRSTRLVFVSPQVHEVLGYSAEELLAEPEHLARLIHPDDYPAFLAAEDRSNRTGEPFFAEYRVNARDGHEVWMQSRAVLVRDDEGHPRFWHGLALDVTDRKRAEEELRAARSDRPSEQV